MFAYCLNNPEAFSDPYGKCAGTIALPTSKAVNIGLCPACGGTSGGGGGIPISVALKGILTGIKAAVETGVKVATVSFSIAGTTSLDLSSFKVADQSPPDGQYMYWEARLIDGKVYVGPGLSLRKAQKRLQRGFDIMCLNKECALYLLNSCGYMNPIGYERHGKNYHYVGYYFHYHTNRDSHSHIWFYGGV